MKNFNLKNLSIITVLSALIISFSIYLFTKDSKEVSLNSNDFFFNEPIQESENSKIVIHIAGEVNSPGILYLDNNSRIADAISAANGTTDIADINKINLAYELRDGQKIYIPSIYDDDTSEYITDTPGKNVLDSSSSSQTDTININTATQSELESLPGIGKSTANKIIDYRTTNGKFKTIEDIMKVSRNWRKQI
jgi:competence protein ComEA